jgi:hypothetical protein
MAGTHDAEPRRHSTAPAARIEQLGLVIRWPEHWPSTTALVSTTSTPNLGEEPLIPEVSFLSSILCLSLS